jgi:hypothetical protein
MFGAASVEAAPVFPDKPFIPVFPTNPGVYGHCPCCDVMHGFEQYQRETAISCLLCFQPKAEEPVRVMGHIQDSVLDFVKKQLPGYRFVSTDGVNLILALNVLENATDPGTVLRQMREALSPDGALIVTIVPQGTRNIAGCLKNHLYSIEEYRALFVREGFKILHEITLGSSIEWKTKEKFSQEMRLWTHEEPSPFTSMNTSFQTFCVVLQK